MSNSLDKVMRVISKKPEFRQEFEIQGLLPWLRKKAKLFSTLKTEFLKDIVRNCGVRTFNRNEIIMRQGEVGDCFYIILGGKISIFIINKDKDGAGEGGDEKSAFADIGKLDKDGKLDRTKLGNFVTSLGSGFPFGEVALVSDDAIRTATIIAEENQTDTLVVDRALYNRAVRDVLATEFKEKRDFIRQHELLRGWLPKYKKQLAMAMYKESFPYDSVLVKQGDPVTNIYFIVSGQVEIRTDPSLHTLQYPKLYRLLEDERDKLIKEKKKQRAEPEESQQPLRKKDNSTSKTLKMCFLGKNESLGELEVLMDMNTYMTTAICSEKTEVLVLEMKHYERLFVKRHQRTIDSLRRSWEVKLNTRSSVLKERNEIILLKLIQMQLHLMHNPPQAQPLERRKATTSVQIAEKLFFSHQGPLFDIDGPGSVFYMIRARERSRLKLKAHQKDRRSNNNNNQQQDQTKHIHAIRLPQTLVMAAHIAGATETDDPSHVHAPNFPDVKTAVASEIDVVAQQNIPSSFQLAEPRIAGARPRRQDPCATSTVPKSFRRIQSAKKSKQERPEDNEKDQVVRSQDEYENKYTLRSHPMMGADNGNVDENLRELETKVEEWLKKDNPRCGANVSKLRRIQLEELEPKPRPGNKIVIRRRSKGNQSDSSTTTTTTTTTTTGSSDVISEQSKKRPTSYRSEVSSSTNPLDKYKILLTS